MKVSESMPLKENINSFQNQVNRELRKKQRSEDKEGGGGQAVLVCRRCGKATCLFQIPPGGRLA